MGNLEQQAHSTAYDAQMQGIIAEHGWAVQGVFPTPVSPGAPFSYTVGLTVKQLPELSIFGLPQQTAHTILNMAATRMVESGAFTPGDPVRHLIDGFDMAVLDVSDPTDLTMVRRFYRSSRSLQLVWPDAQGRFPWHSGYGVSLDAQPLIGLPPTGR